MKTVIKAKASAGDLPPSQNMPWDFFGVMGETV